MATQLYITDSVDRTWLEIYRKQTKTAGWIAAQETVYQILTEKGYVELAEQLDEELKLVRRENVTRYDDGELVVIEDEMEYYFGNPVPTRTCAYPRLSDEEVEQE